MPISTTDNAARHEAIRAMLTGHAGVTSDAGTLAERTLSTWSQISARLAPVIGAQGSDVLFRRALHLTSADFPWLVIPEDHRNSAALLASLKANLASQEPDTAVEAGVALLVTFTDLLATLIGESLSASLLKPVWAPRTPPSEQDISS